MITMLNTVHDRMRSIFTTTSIIRPLVTLSLLVFLFGCVGPQTDNVRSVESGQSASYYLSQVAASSGSSKTQWQLLALQALINEGQLANASQLAGQITANLTAEQQFSFSLSKAELAAKLNQPYDISKLDINAASDADKQRYYQIKLQLDKNSGDVAGQLRDYIALEPLGSNDERQQIIDQTWALLSSLSQEQVGQLVIQADDIVLQGWIDLLYAYHNNIGLYPADESDPPEVVKQKEESQLHLLKNAVSEWQVKYPTHPAAAYLPRNIYGDNYRLPSVAGQRNVALFLPLSGQSGVFGSAIRQGYMDASRFYPNLPAQNIYTYDTASHTLADLIKQAEQQEVTLIVGPLLKEEVSKIKSLSTSLPILALNRVDDGGVDSAAQANKVCYFALSPEDEAKDAASHIYAQQKTRPLLLLPDSDLGRRVASSFAQEWQSLRGDANAAVQYLGSASSLSASMNRGRGIDLQGQIITVPVNNDARTNSGPVDAILDSIIQTPAADSYDVIYVFATDEELTYIKSMLDMATADTTKVVPPIYASSRSNTANQTEDFRRDMEKVQFSEIPLIVNQATYSEQLPSNVTADFSVERLYAMGIDAWQLAHYFDNLPQNQNNFLQGMTGQLSVSGHCDIGRSLVWQQYVNGAAQLVP